MHHALRLVCQQLMSKTKDFQDYGIVVFHQVHLCSHLNNDDNDSVDLPTKLLVALLLKLFVQDLMKTETFGQTYHCEVHRKPSHKVPGK